MLISINQLLPTVLNNAHDWRFCLLQQWPTIVGSLKTRIRLEKIHNDMLIIGVYESHWMQELFLLSRVLINSINKQLGQERITQLRFKLVEEKQHKSFIPTRVHSSSITPQVVEDFVLTSNQQKALVKINDEQLRTELIRFLIRCSRN